MIRRLAIHRALYLILPFASLLAAALPAWARVAPVSLNEVLLDADAVAVARVDQIATVGGVRLAEATVVVPVRGMNAGQRFAFVAQGTWTCDTSTAAPDETALLILNRIRDDHAIDHGMQSFFRKRTYFHSAWAKQRPRLPLYEISDSGRGRLPFHHGPSGDCVTAFSSYEGEGLWTGIGDVRLPDVLYSSSRLWVKGEPLPPDLPRRVVLAPKANGLRLVSARALAAVVRQCLRQQERLSRTTLRHLVGSAKVIADHRHPSIGAGSYPCQPGSHPFGRLAGSAPCPCVTWKQQSGCSSGSQ